MGKRFPSGLLVEVRQAIQLLLEGRLVRNGGHVRVVEGVVAHDVALLRHAADDVRGGFDHVAHHEEGRRGVVLFQGVQDLFRIAVLIAAVKGQIDDLLGRIPQEPGVVLGQVLRAGVAHGGLALLGEGEAPIVGGGRDDGGGGGGEGLSLEIEHPCQEEKGKHEQTEVSHTLEHRHLRFLKCCHHSACPGADGLSVEKAGEKCYIWSVELLRLKEEGYGKAERQDETAAHP